MRWVYNLGVNTIIIFNHDPLQKNIVPPPLETCLPRTIQRTTLFESLPNSLHNSFNKLSQRRKTWKHFPVQINCTQVLQQHSYGGGVSMSMPEHRKNSQRFCFLNCLSQDVCRFQCYCRSGPCDLYIQKASRFEILWSLYVLVFWKNRQKPFEDALVRTKEGNFFQTLSK